jgi:hypothetical protein
MNWQGIDERTHGREGVVNVVAGVKSSRGLVVPVVECGELAEVGVHVCRREGRKEGLDGSCLRDGRVLIADLVVRIDPQKSKTHRLHAQQPP